LGYASDILNSPAVIRQFPFLVDNSLALDPLLLRLSSLIHLDQLVIIKVLLCQIPEGKSLFLKALFLKHVVPKVL